MCALPRAWKRGRPSIPRRRRRKTRLGHRLRVAAVGKPASATAAASPPSENPPRPPLAHPELKLGSTYADTFFIHLPRSSQPTTIGAAADLVKQLQQKLGVATKTHDELVSKAQAQAEAIAVHDHAVAEAAKKKKQAEQLKKEATAEVKAAAKLEPKRKK